MKENKKHLKILLKILLSFIVLFCVIQFLYSERFISFVAKLNEEKIVEESEEYLNITDYSSIKKGYIFIHDIYWYRNHGIVDYIVSYTGFGSAGKIKGIRYSKRGTLVGYGNQNVKFTYNDGKYYWYEDKGDNYEIITPITDNIYYFEFHF